MKVLSLFDGIACARVALDRSRIEVEAYYASEIEQTPIEMTQRNWPATVQLGDVKNVKRNMPSAPMLRDIAHTLNDIDLLIGGSPCQDLSRAKHFREGLRGKRSSLFYEYVRILNEVKPKWFILENVASMPAEAREEMTRHLGVEPIMIDAALVGAQSRRRLFWTNIPGVTQPDDRGILLKDVLQPESEVEEKYYLSEESLEKILEKMRRGRDLPQSQRVRTTDGKSATLSALGGGLGAKTGLYLIVPEATKKGYAVAEPGDSIDLSFPSSTTRRGRVGKRAKNLMTSHHLHVLTEGARVRKLTPIECERLQGVPDGYTAGESDAQRYKALGNAFNAEVIAHILSHIPRHE